MDFEKVWDIVCDHCRERGFYFLDDLIFKIVLMLIGLGMVAGFFFGHR